MTSSLRNERFGGVEVLTSVEMTVRVGVYVGVHYEWLVPLRNKCTEKVHSSVSLVYVHFYTAGYAYILFLW